ncbi:MAG: AAA family ATPase [Verrucomicrobiota bacterium]|jgi:predicted ATPase
MLLKNLKVAGLLSFGPDGMDLPLRALNVFIGPNGSGKSNFLEILALLKAAPRALPEPVKEMGGVREWLWKGSGGSGEATIEALIDNPKGKMDLRHFLAIRENGGRFEVVDERIENGQPYPGTVQPFFHYNFRRGHPMLKERIEPHGEQDRSLQPQQILPEESILSQVKDPDRYPALTYLQENYAEMRLFRNWSLGPGAALRKEQSATGRNDFLVDGGENLALVLSKIKAHVKKELRAGLEQLYEGVIDLDLVVSEGSVQLFLEEEGGRQIPATRLSDGSLRYLCLLAILLHPTPPPVVAIEEPELGLHPDVLPYVGELLSTASQRTQLFVTTHSQIIVDALGEQAESVIVCERTDGVSRFQRLNQDHLKEWLEKFSLGQLWSKGEIGGNRW